VFLALIHLRNRCLPVGLPIALTLADVRGSRRSPQDKRKAYTVAGAFWSDTVQPFITDPANKTIFEQCWLAVAVAMAVAWRSNAQQAGSQDPAPEPALQAGSGGRTGLHRLVPEPGHRGLGLP
jgi:hypothetical protein